VRFASSIRGGIEHGGVNDTRSEKASRGMARRIGVMEVAGLDPAATLLPDPLGRHPPDRSRFAHAPPLAAPLQVRRKREHPAGQISSSRPDLPDCGRMEEEGEKQLLRDVRGIFLVVCKSQSERPDVSVERLNYSRETSAGGPTKVAPEGKLFFRADRFHSNLRMMVPAASEKPQGFPPHQLDQSDRLKAVRAVRRCDRGEEGSPVSR
jgi:hypothetical protein